MNDPRTQLKDLIHVEKGIIPANLCEHIIKDIETREWRPHTWYNAVQGSYGSEETMELDVQSITPELQQLLTPIMIQAGAAYNQKYAYLRCEHIHSLFDGNEKGIPVLSFILNLNDDYEGADLFFWENHVVPLGKGDIIMFPSLFLFPHGVTEAKKGKRYSAVSWAW